MTCQMSSSCGAAIQTKAGGQEASLRSGERLGEESDVFPAPEKGGVRVPRASRPAFDKEEEEEQPRVRGGDAEAEVRQKNNKNENNKI